MDDEALNPDVEYCPICERRNEPGADDTCEHFIGVVFDGDLIWGQLEKNERFKDTWTELQEVWFALCEKPRARRKELRSLCQALGVDPHWLEAEESPADVLRKMSSFWRGPVVESDGMASGSGYSLYHPDSAIVAALTDRLEQLALQLRGKLA